MKKFFPAFLFFAAVLTAPLSAGDGSGAALPAEMSQMNAWFESANAGGPVSETAPLLTGVPFSFLCGDRPSREWIKPETAEIQAGEWNGDTRSVTFRWNDPESGLICEADVTQYKDFPAAEWVVHLRNAGESNSGQIHDFNALDFEWSAPGVMPILVRAKGSDGRIDDFGVEKRELRKSMWSKPVNLKIDSNSNRAFRVGIGNSLFDSDDRPAATWLPFFNFRTGENGLVIGLGWNGCWRASFDSDGKGTTHITAGMEKLDTFLYPNEEIRSPLILTLYYEGSDTHVQNLFRRFVLRYHTPQRDGKPVPTPICLSSWGGTPTGDHLKTIAEVEKRRIPYDCYWIDAGWYGMGKNPCPSVFQGDWGSTVGDWRVNPYRHPNGLAPISGELSRLGMNFLLWFETERACWGVPNTKEHPDWYLTQNGSEPAPGASVLFDLGNPDAREWLTGTIAKTLNDGKISIYREDFNFVPDPYWQAHDEPGRRGMSEIRFVEGLYAFWDGLLKECPGLLIDNCASGGRRLELEAMKRSVALWRTDYNCFPDLEAEAIQNQGAGIANWIPANATSPFLSKIDTYQARSALSAGAVLSPFDEMGDEDWEWLKTRVEEACRARPFFYGDYYPLEGCSGAMDGWLAFCYTLPEAGEGMILAFRRPNSPARSVDFTLPEIDSSKTYIFDNADTGETIRLTGAELNDTGFRVAIPNPRESRLIFWKTEE